MDVRLRCRILCAVATGLAVVAVPAAAGATQPGRAASDWAGPSFCAQYHEAYTGTSFDGVAACASSRSGTVSHGGVTFSRAGFSCLELAARYYDYVTGRAAPSGITNAAVAAFLDGTTGYGVNPESEGQWNTSFNGSLEPGEIISMTSVESVHVGIVISVEVNGAGNGVIRYMDEGGSSSGVETISVDGGVLSSSRYVEFQWTTSLVTNAHPLDNQAHHLCLDAVASGSTMPGDPVQLYTCTNGTNQLWRRAGSHLLNEAWNLCLEANPATDAENHGSIVLATCDGGAYQQWRAVGSTYVNAAHGLCLDAKAGTDANNGGIVELYTCNDGVTQQWPRVFGTYLTTHESACSNPGGGTCDTNGFFAHGAQGWQFNIQCQTSSAGRIYDRTSSGWYTPDAYANTPGDDTFSAGLPRC